MEKTKIISVRIPVSDLEDLEKRLNKHWWHSRNAAIVDILDAVVHCATDDAFKQLISYSRHFHRGEPIHFRYTRK